MIPWADAKKKDSRVEKWQYTQGLTLNGAKNCVKERNPREKRTTRERRIRGQSRDTIELGLIILESPCC